jgi:membrane-bound lytic murein transglycosylase A
MTRMMRCGVGIVLGLLTVLTGCSNKKKPMDFGRELPPGQVALRKISPGEYPDFSKATWNLNVLGRSIDQSIAYLRHPSARRGFPYLDISHERALATCAAFRELVQQAQGRPDAGTFIDKQIRQNFEVYKSVGAPNAEGGGFSDIVLFTGYFTPIYDASLTRQGAFQWPIFKRPANLVADPVTGETAQPYLTRQQIETGALAGQELVWLKSRWEAYVITVQGSARLRLPDGRMYEIGFAGHNGHEYTSPGQAMVRDGVLTSSELNIKRLGEIFAQRPELMDKYLWMNQRTVFFTERPGGPFGALNVPVTTYATIATDKTVDSVSGMTVYPRAMPAFLNVPMPLPEDPTKNWQFQGFMMDQDTGGAIRAAGRTDIYMGVGEPAERVAGHQLNQGELYYIAVKPQLVNEYLKRLPAE